MTTLRRVLHRLRDSLFLIPVLMILVAGGLAGLSLLLDSRNYAYFAENPLILSATVSGGRAIATTVAGATITVAAIVFSITALSTQMAATQYSPRAVGGFFDDGFQQSVIGLVVGTFTYALVILAGLNDVLDQTEEATPTLSVTLTITFGVLSAIAIVAYIDHSLRRMQIDSVLRRIADAALLAVRRENSNRASSETSNETGPPEGKPQLVDSDMQGWIVEIHRKRLLRALPPGSTASVEVRAGEAISLGDLIAQVWLPDPEEDLSASTVNGIRHAIETDAERSVDSDPTFGIRQLADIAVRALSTGVNDPSTAVDVIQHLKVPVREILALEPPMRVLEGAEGQRAFLTETLSRSDYVHSAFSEIRLSAGGQPAVLKALLDTLQDLRREINEERYGGRLAAVEEEYQLTLDMVHKSDLPEPDIQRILRDHQIEDFEDA